MKSIYFIFILLIVIVNNIVKSQEILNYYINNNNNNNSSDSGNGTITNPYQSLCQLNNNLNKNYSPIIINIAFGFYNSTNCTIEINNINEIKIIPYNDNNNNNINNYKNVIIENIKLIINNSNLNINEIIITFSSNYFKPLYICNGSNVNFNNVEISSPSPPSLSLTQSSLLLSTIKSSFMLINIIDSNFILLNQSKLINNGEIDLINSKLILNENSMLDGLFINGRDNSLTIIENSEIIDPNFYFESSELFINNSMISIKNTIYEFFGLNYYYCFKISTSIFKMENTIIKSSVYSGNVILVGTQGSQSTYVTLNNIIISGLKSFQSIFKFTLGTFNINKITFENCISSCLFYIDLIIGETLLSINNINLIGNKNIKFIEILNQSFSSSSSSSLSPLPLLNITISNLITTCDNTYQNFITTIVENNSNNNINLNIINSKLNCIGESWFRNCLISFENLIIETSFKNNLFNFNNNCNVIIKSSIFKTSNYPNGDGFLFSIDNSIIDISNCTINNCESPFLQSKLSNVTINSCNFTKSISIENSLLYSISSMMLIKNCNFNQLNYPILIYSKNSNISIINSNVLKSSFGRSHLALIEYSNIIFSEFNMTECFSSNSLLYFSLDNSTKNLNYNFLIENSTFLKNYDMQSLDVSLIYSKYMNGNIINSNFIGNSFNPLIKSSQSTLLIKNVTYSNNSGSFHYGSNDYYIEINGFTLNNSRIQLDYLFAFENYFNVFFKDIFIINNYLSQYLFIFKGNLYSSITFNNLLYIDNLIVNINGTSRIPFNSIINSSSSSSTTTSQFIFINSGSISFNSSNIINNLLLSSMINIENSILSFSECNLSLNKFQDVNSSKLLDSFKSLIIFENCTINSNVGSSGNDEGVLVGKLPGLINLLNSGIKISFCKFKYNIFPLDRGSIISYFSNSYLDNYQFNVFSSEFSSNVADIGGVFYFSSSLFDSVTPYNRYNIEYNNFSNNFAKTAGGVIWSDDLLFTTQLNPFILSLNKFYNNSCIFGENNLSIMPKDIYLFNNEQYSDEVIEYIFLVKNYFGEIATQVFGKFNTSIKIKTNKTILINETFITSTIYSGKGTFQYRFYGKDLVYTVTILDLKPQLSMDIKINNCSPFKYFDGNSMNCIYCPIGYSLSDEKSNSCVKCNSEIVTCQYGQVFSNENYYMVDSSPLKVYSCANDMCNGNNTCIGDNNIGDLCYYCTNYHESTSIQASKNGIQCCSNFKPILLLPVFLIFLIFALLLSILKYTIFNSILGSIIIFIQVNSVVFFSYRISILPLFRISIDFIDGYCYFSDLNYLHKVLISNLIILFLFIISYSDLTIWLLNKLLKKRIINLPKSIRIILKRNNNDNNSSDIVYKIKCLWSLFQLLFIPIMFNSISLLINKVVNNESLLIIDFTIKYFGGNKFQIILSTFSIIIIILISFILISFVIINLNLFNNRLLLLSNHYFYLNLKRMISKLNYRNGFKWWDIVILIRSIIFITLSLSMIFNPIDFMPIIIAIQLIYTIIFIFINPKKNELSSSSFKKLNILTSTITISDPHNILNIIQSSIFISVGSSLFLKLLPNIRGLIITCGNNLYLQY
ncbi:hypothetical protein ACTFIW_009753 [Dictyostelium discoideum]